MEGENWKTFRRVEVAPEEVTVINGSKTRPHFRRRLLSSLTFVGRQVVEF
ncbi:hypothetical protein HPP92_009755 [Vanilla planifolia]|uniref:Uncharacterized protein n=1 Tax=Vanilla planifolia TaxID=51239 RepID=A0A835R4U4_VANPL|nr:hypothetical protein HPP92_009755 [Vanilla planifolia]